MLDRAIDGGATLEGPATVLVTRFSALGDIVLVSGALQTLACAWPAADIVFVTKAHFAPLVEHNPNIARVITLAPTDSLCLLRKRLRALTPDAFLDLHGKLRSRLLYDLVPPSRRVRWNKRSLWQDVAVRLRLVPYRATMHIAERYHRAVEALVGQSLPHGQLRLWISDRDRARATERLNGAGIDPARPLVGMAPGAMWETKRWPTDRFAALATRCRKDGLAVVLTGSQAEMGVTAQVSRAADGIVDLAGQLDVGELGAVIDACAAFVANDSGPMHMARALGVPTLAFFGSTDPRQFDFTGHRLMFAGVDCSPCSLYGLSRCPKRHFRCMLELNVDSASAALAHLLEAGRPAFVLG